MNTSICVIAKIIRLIGLTKRAWRLVFSGFYVAYVSKYSIDVFINNWIMDIDHNS